MFRHCFWVVNIINKDMFVNKKHTCTLLAYAWSSNVIARHIVIKKVEATIMTDLTIRLIWVIWWICWPTIQIILHWSWEWIIIWALDHQSMENSLNTVKLYSFYNYQKTIAGHYNIVLLMVVLINVRENRSIQPICPVWRPLYHLTYCSGHVSNLGLH